MPLCKWMVDSDPCNYNKIIYTTFFIFVSFESHLQCSIIYIVVIYQILVWLKTRHDQGSSTIGLSGGGFDSFWSTFSKGSGR